MSPTVAKRIRPRARIRYAVNPLAVCEFCGEPTDHPLALCGRYECQLATSERDAAIAVAVAEELDS